MLVLARSLVFLAAFIGAAPAAAENPDGRRASDGKSSAPENSDFGNITSMLAVVPHSEQVYESFPMAIYVDYRAVERAGGAPSPSRHSVLAAMGQQTFEKWTSAMSRVQADPRLRPGKRLKDDPLDLSPEIASEELARQIPEMTSAFSRLRDTLGVEWFAIDRILRFGPRFDPVVVLGGGPDLTDITLLQKALSKQGFERRQVRGVPVWHRFEDNEQRPEAMARADLLGRRSAYPFRLAQGKAARIAALPGLMAGSASWPQITAVIDTFHGRRRSLADDRIIRATAWAITDPEAFDGRLVQAVFIAGHPDVELWALRRVGPYVARSQRALLIETYLRREPLPPYDLAVLADRQEGAEEVTLIALAYQDPQSAELAAMVLAKRLTAYEPLSLRARLLEAKPARIDTHVYSGKDTGISVAVVGLAHVPDPDPETGKKTPGRIFKILQSRFLTYDIDPLIVGRD